MEDTFYMVYNPDGYCPRKKHPTYEDAENEAKRLAQKEDKPIYVLKTCKKVVCVPHFDITEA